MTTPEPTRTFSEAEMLAIVADRVASETAKLNESVATLSSEKADLLAKLDVAAAAHETLASEKASALKEFEDFKAGLDAEKAALAKKDERLAKLKEAAAHLPADFFAADERVARVVAMSDESFDGYVADMAALAPAPGTDSGLPRETAMNGAAVNPPKAEENSTSAAHKFLSAGLI